MGNAYWGVTQERRYILLCGGSPLIRFFSFVLFVVNFVSDDGEIHRRRRYVY